MHVCTSIAVPFQRRHTPNCVSAIKLLAYPLLLVFRFSSRHQTGKFVRARSSSPALLNEMGQALAVPPPLNKKKNKPARRSVLHSIKFEWPLAKGADSWTHWCTLSS